jgi:hypothetical protein
LDQTDRDIPEGEVGETGPEPAPTAGEEAGARGGAGTAEAEEDLEKQILREGADEVSCSAAGPKSERPSMKTQTRLEEIRLFKTPEISMFYCRWYT